MSNSVLRDKSSVFIISIVQLSRTLMEQKKEYILSKQLMRSGTAIGALLHEAEFAQSKPDFISKLSISLKEANETQYWLNLLLKTDFITHQEYLLLMQSVQELVKMLVRSINTLKRKE